MSVEVTTTQQQNSAVQTRQIVLNLLQVLVPLVFRHS
jgi:hypothetical protein